MAKLHTHWLAFDTSKLEQVRKILAEGSRFEVKRMYIYWPKMWLTVMEVESPDDYQSLDMDVDSWSSPITRFERKPRAISNGLPLDRWEAINGWLVTRPA